MLVDAERRAAHLDEVVGDEDDVAIAAVTVAELLTGVELATGARRNARRRLVDGLLATLPVEDYDVDVARAHSGLLAHVRRAGRPRGAHDLVIAATAVARRRVVVTADRRGFDDLPNVEVRSTR